MFVHSTKVISEVFKQELNLPVILQGVLGSSRFTYIQNKIKELTCKTQTFAPFKSYVSSSIYSETCSCVNCSKVEQLKSPDLILLNHESSIDDLREMITSNQDRPPIELSHKFLVFRGIDRITKSNADTLLKIMEEPGPHLKIFATSENQDRIPPAILSRALILNTQPLEQHQLKLIMADNVKLQPFKGLIEEGQFNLGEARLLVKVDYKGLTTELLNSKGKLGISLAVASKLIQKIDDCEDSDKALMLFFRYLKHQIDAYINSISVSNPNAKKLEILVLFHFKKLNKNLLRFLCTSYRAGITDRDSVIKDFFCQISFALSLIK